MIKTIKDFTPPENATAFNPAKTVNVPANDKAEIQLQGKGADVFGLNRILPYCALPTPSDPLSSLSINPFNDIEIEARLNNERILFSGVQASAIRELFADSELLAPLIIQQNNDLRFILTNTSENDIDVNLELLGYDGPSMRKLVQTYQAAGLAMPTPVFLYAKDEIAAGVQSQDVRIATKSVDVQLLRAAVRSDRDEDMHVSLEIYNETVKNGVFVPQFNDEFSNGRRSMVPIDITKNKPFTLKASNSSGNPQTLSFFGEAYQVKN